MQNGIQFETIPTSKTKTATLNTGTTCLFISLCISLCTCLIATSQDRVPCEGVWMWSLLKICISLCQWTKNTRNYVYETENNDLRLDFQNAFHIVFLTSVLEAFKVFEFAWRVFENKPLPSHCPRKNMLYLSWALSAWATRQWAIGWINADPNLEYCQITNIFQLPAYAVETWNNSFSF